MPDEQWMSMNLFKWLTAALLSIGVWVGSIEQRLRNKAGINQVARNPVEADTFGVALAEVNTNLQDIKLGQAENSIKLGKLGEDVATLMERTK